MPIREELWAGRRVLLTGHTGFKGAWLALWLQRLGAEVVGLAPSPPSSPSLYEAANISDGLAMEHAVDVRDAVAVADALASARPEVVLHLAAQPMVRRSLIDPVSTFEINVIGTANVLDAVRLHPASVKAVLLVTSDKCYENQGEASSPDAPGIGGRPFVKGDLGGRPFVEGDPLGGKDPYSASKACAEIVASSYQDSYFSRPDGPRLATARAGNVIGGGDWGEDRLLPDAVRVATGLSPSPLRVRNPDAVRPWQHVLNPLSGYLMLAEELLLSDRGTGAWNFGPAPADAQPVGFVVDRLRELWSGAPEWRADERPNPPEAGWLSLDSSKAQRELGWQPAWDLDRALKALVSWHESDVAGQDMRAVSLGQIEQFMTDAG